MAIPLVSPSQDERVPTRRTSRSCRLRTPMRSSACATAGDLSAEASGAPIGPDSRAAMSRSPSVAAYAW